MDDLYQFLKGLNKYTRNTDVMIAAGLVGILIVMLIPIPPILIDMFLTLSFTLSLLVLLVAIYTTKPLEFSVFPSMLLISTLFRLSLNVASTRLILAHGNEGASAAGGGHSSLRKFCRWGQLFYRNHRFYDSSHN